MRKGYYQLRDTKDHLNKCIHREHIPEEEDLSYKDVILLTLPIDPSASDQHTEGFFEEFDKVILKFVWTSKL